jgi:excisionase family DNA binding protein
MEANLTRHTITVTEAAKVLGIGRSAAYEAARSGQIPTIRIGRRVLVPRIALENLLKSAGQGHVE